MAIDKTAKPWLANNKISKEFAHDPWNPPELAEESEDDLGKYILDKSS
jgi:hypothetical protein